MLNLLNLIGSGLENREVDDIIGATLSGIMRALSELLGKGHAAFHERKGANL